MYHRILRAAVVNILDDIDTDCNNVLSENNDERCISMECDANYQCHSRNCDEDLTCQPFVEDSKFAGIITVVIFGMILAFVITFAIFKLCRKSQNQKFFAKMVLNNAADK